MQKSNKVPKDHNFFRKNYNTKYNVKTPTGVDTSSIYKEIYSLGFNGKKYFRTDGYNSFFRFYANGRVNSFTYKDDGEISLNPNKKGYRGVCYVKDNKEIISLVAPISQDQTYGIKNYELKVKGDTLFVTYKQKNSFPHIYIKQKLSKKNLNFNANW